MKKVTQTKLDSFFVPKENESGKQKEASPDLLQDMETPEEEVEADDNGQSSASEYNEEEAGIKEFMITDSPRVNDGQELELANVDIVKDPYQNPNDLPPPQISLRQNVNFQAKWYKEFPWLHYQKSSGSVVCHICLQAKFKNLFKSTLKIEEAFISIGFKNWKKGKEKFECHQSGSQHKEAVLKLEQLRHGESVAATLSSYSADIYRKNRNGLRLIVSSLKYLGRQGLAIRGHEEDDGNLMELLRLRAEDNPEFKEWLSRPKTFTSHDIQNEILQLMCNSILRNVVKRIKMEGYCSLIVDETTDISTKEQVSISLRHVDGSTLLPEESFLGLYETDSTTGETLAKIIEDVLQRFDIPINSLRGQCYDGASNMKGKFNGVQTRILQKESRALYVHCFNHSLNLALQDIAKKTPKVRDTLQYLNDVAVLFDRSMKRTKLLENIQENAGKPPTGLKPLCPTRWCVRIASIKAMLKNYDEVLKALTMLNESRELHATAAGGLLHQFEKADILLLILMCRDIFEPCEQLGKVLQTVGITIHGAIENSKATVKQLQKLQQPSSFDSLWNEMEKLKSEYNLKEIKLPRKRRVPQRYRNTDTEAGINDLATDETSKCAFRNMYYEVLENLITELNRRFNQQSTEELLLLEEILCQSSDNVEFQERHKNILKKFEFDESGLKSQISVFRGLNCSTSSIEGSAKDFVALHPDVQRLLPELGRFIQLLVVVPSSTASAERSFSMLRRLKTYLRSTMSQKRLNHLSILHVYQEEVDLINVEEIVNEFVLKNSYRVSIFGKN